jgi:hypothetical protein
VVLSRAETQEGCDVADFVEFRIVVHKEKFDVVLGHAWQDRFADVDDFACLASAYGTEADEVGVEVATAGGNKPGTAGQSGLAPFNSESGTGSPPDRLTPTHSVAKQLNL